MCLQTKQHKPLIAQTDITAYKLVYRTPIGTYLTAFTHTPIPNACMTGRRLFIAKGNNKDKLYLKGGFIHTFASQQILASASYEIWECIIPKGTPYYLGKDLASGWWAYASKKIRFIKHIA